jgi:ketosteroid isomerase-like protein
VKLALARAFVEAVAARDLEAAEKLLDPNVDTTTPRGTLRGIAACRQVLEKASGDEQFAVEQTEPDFEEIEGEIVARTHEIARWRATGEIAYERHFAVRLTLDDERIVRIVVMPGGRAASVGRRSRDTTLTRSGRGRQARFALAWSAISDGLLRGSVSAS